MPKASRKRSIDSNAKQGIDLYRGICKALNLGLINHYIIDSIYTLVKVTKASCAVCGQLSSVVLELTLVYLKWVCTTLLVQIVPKKG